MPDDAVAVLPTASATNTYVQGSTYVSVCPAALSCSWCLRTSVLNITGGLGGTAPVVLPVNATRQCGVYLDRGQAALSLRLSGVYRAATPTTTDRPPVHRLGRGVREHEQLGPVR